MVGQGGADWAAPGRPSSADPAGGPALDHGPSPWDSTPQAGPPPAPAWPPGHPYGAVPGWPPLWGPPYAAPPPTSAWAVVALVTGLLALVPIAVGAGIAGLVQTSGGRQSGRGLAVGGLVAAGLWTVAIAVTVALLAGSQDARLGPVAWAGSTTVEQCLAAPRDEASSTWTTADCAAPHDGEVYLVALLGDVDWPGQDAVDARADDACYSAFEPYVGRDYVSSAYDYGWFGPDAVEWSAGQRHAVCVVLPYDDDVLQGPVRGSGE